MDNVGGGMEGGEGRGLACSKVRTERSLFMSLTQTLGSQLLQREQARDQNQESQYSLPPPPPNGGWE